MFKKREVKMTHRKRKIANITKWLGSICFILAVILFCFEVTQPESKKYFIPGALTYYSLLDDRNIALDKCLIGIGDNVEVIFSSKAVLSRGKVKSINRNYALLGTTFTPDDRDLAPWMG